MSIRSTESRRKAREGLVSVRVGATKIGGKPRAFWVPIEIAERIERMCEKAASPGHSGNRA